MVVNEKYQTKDWIENFIPDNLAEFGYTKEQYEGSRLQIYFKIILYSLTTSIEKMAYSLMKQYSLTYGEALGVAARICLKAYIDDSKF